MVLKDTALGSIIMYTDLLQESRRLGSMYFNILQTLVMAAVIYFVACWLLSRLAEWLPSRMQQRTAAPTEPEPLAPIAAGDPSNVNQIAVAKEVEELPFGGAPRKYHVHHRGTNARSAIGVAPGTNRDMTSPIPNRKPIQTPASFRHF